jgi:transcriptional regulator with XRE-family HTH domain
MEQPIHLQLKATRDHLGLSLEDVAHQTRIPVSRLQKLESGDYASFGSMAYARSFLRAYCEFLGLEAEEAVSQLPRPILGGAHDYYYLTESLGPWLRLGNSKLLRTPQQHAHQVEVSAGRSVVMRAAGAIAIVVCGIVAWAMYVGGTPSAQSAKKEKEEQKAAAMAPATQASGFTAAVETSPVR